MESSRFSIANKNRSQLFDLIADEKIARNDRARAIELAELTPTPQAWYSLIDKLLLWLGALLLSFAILFFIAYNWNNFGDYAKFALIEVLLIATVGLYWLWYDEPLKSRVILLVASILTGVLLALFGQTYQTGADPWELFFNWALLITPWVVISRFSVMWIVWIALLNLSILLYINTFDRFFWFYWSGDEMLAWILFGFNTAVWIVWELSIKRFAWLEDGWSLRLIAVVSGTAISWLMIMSILERVNPYAIVLWLIWLTTIYVRYRRAKINLFMLTIYSFSIATILISFLIDKTTSYDHFGNLFFIGLITVGISTLFTLWLKSIHREASHVTD